MSAICIPLNGNWPCVLSLGQEASWPDQKKALIVSKSEFYFMLLNYYLLFNSASFVVIEIKRIARTITKMNKKITSCIF
jgi:hypothetical protein